MANSQKIEAPSTCIRFRLKTEVFFFRFGLPSTRIQWKRSTKTHLSKTFSETRASRIRQDGRKQRFSKYMRWYHKLTYFNNTHALWGMLSSIILAFSYGRAKSILIRFVWTRIFFKTGLRAFSQFWLPKSTLIVHHNQLLMTKFGRILCLTRKWRQKCSPLQVNAPLTEKTWGRGWVVLVVKTKMADTSLVSRVRTTAGTRRNNG